MSSKNYDWYFRWLYKKVEKRSKVKYWKLLQLLNDREFFWSVPNDDNRLEDGLRLREIFARTRPSFLPPGPSIHCSILEMLVALSGRMEDILSDSRKGDRTSDWFWEMIANLGLDQFHDGNFTEANDSGVIDYILNQFVNRTYDRRGHGSIFPSKKSVKNLAKVEIWYQMMNYLDENYAE